MELETLKKYLPNKPSADFILEFYDKAISTPNMYEIPEHCDPYIKDKKEKKAYKPPLSGVFESQKPDVW